MAQENTFKLLTQCVQLDVSALDWQDAIRKACHPLVDGGFVKDGYSEDVISREMQWATGLPTTPAGVAIPHALKPDNVVDEQIAVWHRPSNLPKAAVRRKMRPSTYPCCLF